MNYSRIKELLQKKNISIEKLCHAINITKSGFHMMVKNDTMKIRTLEDISKYLKVDINLFFVDLGEFRKVLDESIGKEKESTNQKTDELVNNSHTKLVGFMQDQINDLKDEVRFLRTMIEKNGSSES